MWLKNKPVEIFNHIRPETTYVHADINRLYQLIQNIVGNACKFTESGTIEIAAEKQSNGMVLIKISDTGSGISHEDKIRIFKPFEQAFSI